MPNQFAPRALTEVVADHTERLRFHFDGDPARVKEWHGIIDLLGPEATEEFRDRYHRCEEVPHLVTGFEDIGYDPSDTEGGEA